MESAMTTRRNPSLACLLIPVLALLPMHQAGAEAAQPFEFGSPSAVTRAGAVTGRVVETRDGEELGRVHDFALDLTSGRIAYVVVSVGSFLIEDSLIAVAPAALRQSADADGRLVLETDPATLRNARRFSAGDWPVRADVLAAADSAEPPAGGPAARPDDADAAAPRRGSATISDASRTATLSAGERNVRFEERPAPGPVPETPPPPETLQPRAPGSPFGRLDSDRNGVLNRAEIAHELRRDDSYSDIDLDASGNVDPMEFDAWRESRSEDQATR